MTARRQLARSHHRYGNLSDQDADYRTAEFRRQLVEHAKDLAPWKLFLTLTFAGMPSERTAEAELHAWLDYLARWVFRRDVFCFYVADFMANGQLHFHVLLDIDGHDTAPDPAEQRTLEGRWRGHSRIRAYIRGGGAEEYMVRRHHYWDTHLACARFGPCRSRCVNPGWSRK